jgi:hypothetical protein
MSDSQFTATDLVARLRMQAWRRQSVIVFRGTGVNAWHYYPFLRNFTLAELGDFAAIYGVSGGAAIVWFHVLALTGLFDDTVYREFDHIIRATMNERGFAARFGRLVHRRFPYSVDEVYRFLAALPAPEARRQTLSQVALPNFSIVAHDVAADRLLIIDGATHPDAPMIELLARAGTPQSRSQRQEASAGLEGVSDFDFAPGHVKRDFQQHLLARHAGCNVYQVNLLRDGVDRHTVFIKACGDPFPRVSQALDFGLLFTGLPNPRYRVTFERSQPLPLR